MIVGFAFLFISIFYSAVGFGGGSSYIAILALLDFPYERIPIIALTCNLCVVTGGVYHFWRQGHFSWKLFWPFAISSIPAAFVGGQIPISKEIFLTLLGICLLLVALRLFAWDRLKGKYSTIQKLNPNLGMVIGACLGLLSGIVGIGGGIFLSPVLLLMRWGHPKQIAATAAFFIFTNSIAGLTGQLLKHSTNTALIKLWPEYWYLFLIVLIGGQIGSRLGSGPILSQRVVKDLTATLVLLVAVRILLN